MVSDGGGRRCAPGVWRHRRPDHRPVGSEVEVVVTRVVVAGTRLGGGGGLRLLLGLGLVAVTLAAGHLGGGESQRRSGLLDVQLEGDALVALLVGELVLLELADDEHPVALADRLSEVLAVLLPQRAAQERRIAVQPHLGLLVEGPALAGDGERRDGDLLLGVPQLGIGRELTDERDAVVRSHVNSSFVSVTSHLLCHMAATRWPRRESPAYPTSGRGFPLVGRARSVRAGC